MDILTIDYTSNDAGYNFSKSLHHTGFAVIKNHSINYNLVKEIFLEWQEFFKTENKYKYLYNKHLGDGYVATTMSETAKGESIPDLKEFYQIYLPWGRYPKELSEKTELYFRQVYNFGKSLLAWIDSNTPYEIKQNYSEPLTSMLCLEQSMLRVLHYPPVNIIQNKGAIRAAAHEDINLITLLPASNAMGLQVKTKQNTWLDVGTNEGEIIVNVGDMLQECSKHYYISTTHRVVNPSNESANKSRMSMPLFMHPRADVFLSDKYSRAENYLKERLYDLGLLD